MARVLDGRSVDTPPGKPRILHKTNSAGRAPGDSNGVVMGFSKTLPSTCRGVGAVERRPRAWGGACPALGHNTTTPSLHCAAHAPWEVDRWFTGRIARAPRATGVKGDDHGRSQLVPSTHRGVGAVEPRPTAWEGARPALIHHTTTPSSHYAARELRGR